MQYLICGVSHTAIYDDVVQFIPQSKVWFCDISPIAILYWILSCILHCNIWFCGVTHAALAGSVLYIPLCLIWFCSVSTLPSISDYVVYHKLQFLILWCITHCTIRFCAVPPMLKYLNLWYILYYDIRSYGVSPPPQNDYVVYPMLLHMYIQYYDVSHTTISRFPVYHTMQHLIFDVSVPDRNSEQRQLISSKRPGRMGIHHHEQGTAFPSKGISFLSLCE
jgi:hypothetical protein